MPVVVSLIKVCAVGRGALGADNAEADLDGERQLGWYASGHKIALDVARGLSFLHGINVSLCRTPLSPRTWLLAGQ